MNVMTPSMPSVATVPDAASTPDSPLTPLGAQIFAAMFAALMPKVQPPVPPPVAATELAETADSDAPEKGKVGVDDPSDDAGVELAMETAIAALTAARVPAGDLARQLASLDPALQEKLARVVQSMKEAGHDVSMTEPLPFRAGTTPLLTPPSASVDATAGTVDLLVDGKAGKPEAYAKLLTLLQAEGLQTLNGADSRALQQSGVKILKVQTDASPPSIPSPLPSLPPNSALSRSAAPPPASVVIAASTNAVATAIAGKGDKGAAAAPTPQPLGTPAITALAAAAFQEMAGDGMGHKRRDTPEDLKGLGLQTPLGPGGTSVTSTPQRTDAVETLSAAAPLNIAQRVLDATPDSPARPLSQITMSLDSSDRVQVVMRGPAVTAAIDVVDPTVAQQLVAREGELTRALARHSLDMDALTVRASEPGDGHLDSRHRGQRDTRRHQNPNGGRTP